jgi:hypothetical protein
MPPLWRGRALSLQLDHIDGNGRDHRLENLRMLCLNCHSQTDTFGVKNRENIKKKRSVSSSQLIPVSLSGKTPDSDSGERGSNP